MYTPPRYRLKNQSLVGASAEMVAPPRPATSSGACASPPNEAHAPPASAEVNRWSTRRNLYVRNIRAREIFETRAHPHIHVKKLVGAAAMAELRRAPPPGEPDVHGRRCLYDHRAGFLKTKGEYYPGSTGACTCGRVEPAAETRRWAGETNDAAESKLPTVALLMRELERERPGAADAAAALLAHQYPTVGALRDGWADAAAALRTHLRDGDALASALAESFECVPLRPFLRHALRGAAGGGQGWKDAHDVLRCHHHTAGDMRRAWRYCKRLLTNQVAGGEAMCAQLEASWLFRMRAPPAKQQRGWWLTHIDGGGADVPSRLLRGHDRAASRWGKLHDGKLAAQGQNVLLGLLGKKKHDAMHGAGAKAKVMAARVAH